MLFSDTLLYSIQEHRRPLHEVNCNYDILFIKQIYILQSKNLLLPCLNIKQDGNVCKQSQLQSYGFGLKLTRRCSVRRYVRFPECNLSHDTK